MSSRAATARQRVERTGGHPVITLAFDLDPEELATHVQAALVQDAAVIAYDEPQDELPPARPTATLLRF